MHGISSNLPIGGNASHLRQFTTEHPKRGSLLEEQLSPDRYPALVHAAKPSTVADYAKRFTCISLDPRGAGETDKPAGAYSMELLADDVAAFMQTIGVEQAHVSGVSFGAATGLWLAGKYTHRVKSLSLHSCWTNRSVSTFKVVVKGFGGSGKVDSVEMSIRTYPYCSRRRLCDQPEYIDQLAAFVRSRPKQPLDTFVSQSSAVIAHDAHPIGTHQSPNSDHFRSPRHRYLTALRRHAQEMESRVVSFWFLKAARMPLSTKAWPSSTKRP